MGENVEMRERGNRCLMKRFHSSLQFLYCNGNGNHFLRMRPCLPLCLPQIWQRRETLEIVLDSKLCLLVGTLATMETTCYGLEQVQYHWTRIHGAKVDFPPNYPGTTTPCTLVTAVVVGPRFVPMLVLGKGYFRV